MASIGVEPVFVLSRDLPAKDGNPYDTYEICIAAEKSEKTAMSSQKGNVHRSRAQKHKNSTAFNNTKYDTSQRTKNILSVSQDGLCKRCKEKIEWKIKYKKYKPLTKPATCTRCHQKTVKKAYYTVCQPCATSLNVCAKCAEKKEIVTQFGPDEQTQAEEQNEMELEMKMLSERERRTLFRLKAQGKLTDDLDGEEEDTDCLDGEKEETGYLDGVKEKTDNLVREEEEGEDQSAPKDSDEVNCDNDSEDDDDLGSGEEEEGNEGEEKVDAHALFE